MLSRKRMIDFSKNNVTACKTVICNLFEILAFQVVILSH